MKPKEDDRWSGGAAAGGYYSSAAGGYTRDKQTSVRNDWGSKDATPNDEYWKRQPKAPTSTPKASPRKGKEKGGKPSGKGEGGKESKKPAADKGKKGREKGREKGGGGSKQVSDWVRENYVNHEDFPPPWMLGTGTGKAKCQVCGTSCDGTKPMNASRKTEYNSCLLYTSDAADE